MTELEKLKITHPLPIGSLFDSYLIGIDPGEGDFTARFALKENGEIVRMEIAE